MKVQEHSKVAHKYLNPTGYLSAMFPSFRECSQCHSIITLETIHDVYHEQYTHEHASYTKNWLQWNCTICGRGNQFTAEDVLVDAHRSMVRSKYDIAEYITIFLAALVLIAVVTSPIWY